MLLVKVSFYQKIFNHVLGYNLAKLQTVKELVLSVPQNRLWGTETPQKLRRLLSINL